MSAPSIIAATTITQVWTALGGPSPQHGRAPAFYREGNNPQTVSLNDEKGCWFDHRDGIGGGILDLIQRVLDGSRADALQWLSEFTGVQLEDRPLTRSERRNFAAHRAQQQGETQSAEFFRIAATCMAESVLSELPEDSPGRYAPTQLLLKLKEAQGPALDAIYRGFLAKHPELTAGLVYAGERAWRRMCTRLARFIVAGSEACDVA